MSVARSRLSKDRMPNDFWFEVAPRFGGMVGNYQQSWQQRALLDHL